MVRNVMLLGRAKAGKGVISDYLANEHSFVALSFARPMKVEIGRLLLSKVRGISPEFIDANEAFEYVQANKDALRSTLQAFGSDAVRTLVGADYWVNLTMRLVKGYNALGLSCVIDDARFPNEFGAGRDNGFKLIRVQRPLWHYRAYGVEPLQGAQAGHESESYVDTWPVDATINNDGARADAQLQACSILGLKSYYQVEGWPH